MANIFVPVVDTQGTPLMPTTPSRARRWIQSGQATHFWKGGVFCVRLNREPSGRSRQPIAVGIDPGSKREGIVVAGAAHTYLNIQAQARDGVKEAEQDSTRMRRTRRARKRVSGSPKRPKSWIVGSSRCYGGRHGWYPLPPPNKERLLPHPPPRPGVSAGGELYD